MTGRAPHNADGTQRTETKGDRSTTFSQQSTQGRMNKIEGQGQLKETAGESLGGRRSNGGPND
jgi:hypothetical protein